MYIALYTLLCFRKYIDRPSRVMKTTPNLKIAKLVYGSEGDRWVQYSLEECIRSDDNKSMCQTKIPLVTRLCGIGRVLWQIIIL